MDRLFFRPLAQLAHQVERQRHGKLHAPGPACDIHQPAVAGPARADLIGRRDHALDRLVRRDGFRIRLDRQRQHFLVPAAQHGERAVAGCRRPAFGMIEIVGEFLSRRLLAIDDLGLEQSGAAHMSTQLAEQIGIFGDALGDDVARAFQRRLYIRAHRP